MRPLIILAVSIISIVLIFFLQTVHFETPEMSGFPLVIWLIVFVPLWVFRAYLEISGKFDDKKAWCVTLNMASIYSIIATFGILILQGSMPNWWENLTSGHGKYFLYMLPLWFVLKYILPGTGGGAVKWGGRIATAVGVFLVLGIIATAIGSSGKSSDRYDYTPRRTERVVVRQVPAPVPKSSCFGHCYKRYKICWSGGTQCIWPKIVIENDTLSIDYAYNNGLGEIRWTGTRTEGETFQGQYVFTGRNNSHTRKFEINLQNLTGWRIGPAGERDELTIKKLS